MQDDTKFNTSKLVRTQIEYHRTTIGKNILSSTIIGDNLLEVKTEKQKVKIKTPLYLAGAILAYSKMLMLDFIYNCLYKVYAREDIELCYTDTDSIYFKVKNLKSEKNIEKRYQSFVDKFKNNGLYELFFQKQGEITPGKMSLEKMTSESIWLKPKCYSHKEIVDDLNSVRIKETCKIKGVKLHQNLELKKLETYKASLFGGKVSMAKNLNIRKTDKFGTPQLYTMEQNKIGIDSWDNKRLWLNAIESEPFGLVIPKKYTKSLHKRLIHNLHHRVSCELKRNKLECFTEKKFMEYLGCDGQELKQHIQNQWSKVNIHVCWANYGKLWDLDHIVPVSCITKFSDKTQHQNFREHLLKTVCNYKNIQPLSKSQNCKKRDCVPEDVLQSLNQLPPN